MKPPDVTPDGHTSPTGTMRVVLADDHTLVRAGLRKLLKSLPGIEVVGEADNGLALLALVEQLFPDLVLVDVAMPRLGGLEATARVLAASPLTRVLILSMHQSEAYVRFALRYGATGYHVNDAAPQELELAILTVLRGETYLSPACPKGVLSDCVQRLRADERNGAELSPRQREVLKLIAESNSSKDIARSLSLSVKTVDTRRRQLMKQLDIHDVAGLVRYAMRVGLISPLL